jgi:alpha-tubulin suppressor-like RCC1 family protein
VDDTRVGWTLMDTDVVKAATNNTHSHWIKSDGTLWGVGSNDAGPLGVTSVTIKTSVPVKIAAGVSETILGTSGALFIKQDGSLWGMGSNHAQRLGTDLPDYLRTPEKVADNVISASMSGLAVYYVNSSGELWENWLSDRVLSKGVSRPPLRANASHYLLRSQQQRVDVG